MTRFHTITCIGLTFSALLSARGQGAGVQALDALVSGLTVTPRVLLIGARPGDADADVIAWLAKGHHVQTAYLSLTRGESTPNFAGLESGAAAGAFRVREALDARQNDGGEQYFTRAYDFGASRTAKEAFEQWDHAEILGDVVTIVRAFRPHVIIARFLSDTSDRDGQRQVSAILAREVFDAAADTIQFPTNPNGLPWSPQALYEPGPGVRINSGDYDRTEGKTYADMAIASRSSLRSLGFSVKPWQVTPVVEWKRVAHRVSDSIRVVTVSGIFAGIDTSFIRLQRDVQQDTSNNAQIAFVERSLTNQLPLLLSFADSVRTTLDLRKPAGVAPHLRRVVELASAIRGLIRGCYHPARDANASLSNVRCKPQWGDLDASVDLVLRRATDALFIASGITIESVADREFLASGDTALVAVIVTNNGDNVISVNDISITGGIPIRMTQPVIVQPHSSAELARSVYTAPYAHPWWIFKRNQNFFPSSTTPLDGVPRPAMFMRSFTINSTAVPDDMRRLNDVKATITIGTTTVTSSVGSVVFKTADPLLGLHKRVLSGVPAVTMDFERGLEWAQAGKPLKKQVRVTVQSYSDVPQQFALKPAITGGVVRLDSLPAIIKLAPHEAQDVTIAIRGTPDTMAYVLPLNGVAQRDTFNVGFRTAQYPYLNPIHVFRETGVKIQAVDVEIPERLSVVYIRGVGDDADIALKQLGVPRYVLNNEGLIRFDLENISTIVIGPNAFRGDPGLKSQTSRLTEFARKGGTVVILGNPDIAGQSGLLPYPVAFSRPYAEQVTRSDAPVAVLEPKSRLLTWPNLIRSDDWAKWAESRALTVPSSADPRYTRPIETHDPRQPDNRNSILMATVGKGRIIYTSLTLTQQISSGVPGAMRIFINLVSAGLSAETVRSAAQ